MNIPHCASEHVCILPCRCICTGTLRMWGKPAREGVCVCVRTWVGVNSLCGDGNLLAAHWLTDVEGGEAFFKKLWEEDEGGGM